MQVRYEMPLEMRSEYLAHAALMEKAAPFLEDKARQRLGLPPKDRDDHRFDEDGEDQ